MNIVAEEYKSNIHLIKPMFDTSITDQIRKTKKDFKEHIKDIMPLIGNIL